MRTLVTGATGFTGGVLARYLVGVGERVRALVRPASSSRSRGLCDAGVEVVSGDLSDAASLEAACQDVEVVYHIAATYRSAGRAAAYRAVNVDGTRRLLDAAQTAGVGRVVHCSTGGVHGHIEHPPATEEAPLSPGDIYQETKLEGERLARDRGEAGGIDVVVARPIGIYGPGDTRFLKLFRLASGRVMLGDGSAFYHLTFVEDLVEGFHLCGTVPAAAGRTYLLAGRRYTTLKRLVELIASELGSRPPSLSIPVWPVWLVGAFCELACVPFRVEPPLHRRRVEFFTKSRAFDASRARRELGFVPKVELEEGIHRTAVWYRGQGML